MAKDDVTGEGNFPSQIFILINYLTYPQKPSVWSFSTKARAIVFASEEFSDYMVDFFELERDGKANVYEDIGRSIDLKGLLFLFEKEINEKSLREVRDLKDYVSQVDVAIDQKIREMEVGKHEHNWLTQNTLLWGHAKAVFCPDCGERHELPEGTIDVKKWLKKEGLV
jgi:hypothetical protein